MDADIEALDWLTADQREDLQQLRDTARGIHKAESAARYYDVLMVILAALFLAGQIAGAVL